MKFRQLKKIYLLIFFLALVFYFFPLVTKAQKGSFSLRPLNGSFGVGSTFYVDVLINAEGIALNAAQATISFSSDKLKVTELSKKSSIFTLWPNEPVFSNSEGKISFTGGLPTPGFIGESGKVITILFQAKAVGHASINFSGEIITANDPFGTNIFSSSQKGSYSIVASSEFQPSIEVPLEGEDKDPPLPFEITIDNEGDPTNPTPLLYFQTRDERSGMSHYELKIGDKDFIKVEKGKTTPFRLPVQTPGILPILVKAIDRAGNFTESKAEVRIESIAVPKITICPKVFKSGEEMMYISGTALPETKIIISLLKNEELAKEWEVTSDAEGDWSLAKEGLFKSGNYKILVRARDSRGAESYPSETCLLKIILGGISIGPWIITYKTLTFFGLILFLILLLLFIYLIYRVQKTRKIIEIEVLDLKKKFYKEYYELRIGIEKELKILRNIQTERELNQGERARQEELLKDLEDVERVIRVELKDIEEAK
jgi:cbb3-type cytochrome oxidase subunit 3